MAKFPPLTKKKALEMQEALISEYRKPEFQAKLRFVLDDTCSAAEKRKIDQELRELRERVGARFGFEASPQGVAESIELFTPTLLAEPEIKHNCDLMNTLLYPQLQDELSVANKTGVILEPKNSFPTWDNKAISLKCRAELAAKYEAEKEARKNTFLANKQNMNGAFFFEKVGRHWTVIGGNGPNGILVRKGEELNSPKFPTRLAKNSIIEELELIGDRLHYKKLAGEGPDFGWVSIMVKGATLLKPVSHDEMLESQMLD